MKPTAQGAEALVYIEGKKVRKVRPSKSYRIKQIDALLRGTRTRREAKILQELAAAGFPAPRLLYVSDVNMQITMERLPGKKVRDVLTPRNCVAIGKTIGRLVGRLHLMGIVHGDLTTSNMMKGKELAFLDFGLSFYTKKTEDFAVDLHLLKETMHGTHPSIADKTYAAVVSGYKTTFKDWRLVLDRLEQVEIRGRNKKAMGS